MALSIASSFVHPCSGMTSGRYVAENLRLCDSRVEGRYCWDESGDGTDEDDDVTDDESSQKKKKSKKTRAKPKKTAAAKKGKAKAAQSDAEVDAPAPSVAPKKKAAGGSKLPGVELGGIDFVGLATSLGCPAKLIQTPEELAQALPEEFSGKQGPSLLHVKVDPGQRFLY